ncbi:MAG: hypothetical protein ACYSOV_01310, partial [Planctomycetota bacterium]
TLWRGGGFSSSIKQTLLQPEQGRNSSVSKTLLHSGHRKIIFALLIRKWPLCLSTVMQCRL